MHIVNDALFTGLTPLLPLIALDLSLSYTQVGALRAAYSGTSAAFQIPAGIAAERFGEQLLLSLGTGSVGVGLAAMGLAGSFWFLFALCVLGGLGGNIQHPVATAVVSRIFDGPRRSSAIGALNFAGDLGKVAAPLIVGAVALYFGWRGALMVLGTIGAAFALFYLLIVPEPARPVATVGKDKALPVDVVSGWGIERRGLFAVLMIVGMLDAAARGAGLTFLPFVLIEKGIDPALMSLYFTVLFAAGAAGKFLCGPIADRYGTVTAVIVTELITAVGFLAMLWVPAEGALIMLIPLGFALNGTSSILYAMVASFVDVRRRARGYGLFFTATLLSSALAPVAYGALADFSGLVTTFVAMAILTALIAPLAIVVRAGFRQHQTT